MRELNLGDLQGKLLFFGGPYSNLQATQALKSLADVLQIQASNIICTGDTVAYCAHPNETVALLREWGITVVMGNCEESLGWRAPDCGCGFEEGSACEVLSESWYRFANQNIEIENRDWMRSLPRIVRFSFHNKSFAVIHGGIQKINQFIFASTDSATKAQTIKDAKVDGIVAGHCGLPFTEQINGKLWHNPGVIGVPANDGTPRVWYSLWNTVQGKIHIEKRSLEYDANLTRANMLKAGLDNGYAQALMSGLWPSLDVLPNAERAQQGKTLNESVFEYCVAEYAC